MAYKVTTFDVCAAGFERLRTYEEFILVASINAETDSADLLEQWKDDLQAHDRGEDFNYNTASAAIDDYYSGVVHPLFDRRSNPFGLEPSRDDIGSDEGCNAYLYIRVDDAHTSPSTER